jgi:V/A-type H+-transporting ATPase subunit A
MQSGIVLKVAGPLVVAKGLIDSKMYDMVKVGADGLMGEIIEMRGDEASIQVYEETQGIGPGDPVEPTGAPLSVELGPGMLGTVYDGVQRPLEALADLAGAFLHRGIDAPGLDREKLWDFTATAAIGQRVGPGQIIGTVPENELIEHRIMIEPGLEGELISLESGRYTVTDTIGQLRADDGTIHDLCMIQRWPVRTPRPRVKKLSASEPLISGTRIIDTMFPLLKGGTACIPGPFGAGKTVTQHQIAKWANAEVVIFVGCGERGNEITDILMEFSELVDPYSGHPLMERTILVANTSNMPVAAREASVYTGITMAEYFRDMGYEVVLQADSTSRWAEAMREISARLEEMPGDEGYPAYLSTRLAAFYERAGKVESLGGSEGSVTVIGSVSPPGGDLSEPVVQNTLRVTKIFWALQDTLAFKRHFPAIDWLASYSLYLDEATEYWDKHVSRNYRAYRDRAIQILQKESELEEIARLVGLDALSLEEQTIMDAAKILREDFLQQNAFRDDDQYTPLPKQCKLLELILAFYDYSLVAIESGVKRPSLANAPVRDAIAHAKYLDNYDLDAYDDIIAKIKTQLKVIAGTGAMGARCAWEVDLCHANT